MTPFTVGQSLAASDANFEGTNLRRTEKVGSYPANSFGLRDMHGNVWQWCADWYDKDTYGKSPSSDPTGPANGSFRVLRGGSWQESGQDCRSAKRHHSLPGYRNHAYGFRVVSISGGN
jgi:formylglycine-generating enzyme required for sulfatase activity